MNKKIVLSLMACALVVPNLAAAVVLDEIKVTSATKSEQSIRDVTSNVEVITALELEEKQITTVPEALNRVSGISLTQNGGLGKAASVFVRGFDNKRVLVLIDGIRYNDVASIGGAPFEHLMVSDIERIELVKGAQSGIWGADASAGVINIITKTPEAGLHGSLNGEFGSFSTYRYGAMASYKEDNFYVRASSQKIDSDGFSALTPRYEDVDNYEDDGYENRTTSLKVGYKFNEENKIDASMRIIDAQNEYDGYKKPNGAYFSTTKDRFSSVKYQNKNSFATTDVYFNRSVFNRDYPQGFTKEFDGVVNEYGLKSHLPYLDGTAFLIAGVDYKTFEHKNSIGKKYNNKAIFVTNSNKFNNAQTNVTQSIRVDRYSAFDNKTTGKIGIKHNFSSDLYAVANIGTAYNVPTLYNLYSAYGNANLNAEDTRSIDVGIGYENFTVTYFHNTIEDMIDYDFATKKYANISGKSKLKGYELSYSRKIFEDFLLSANYTHLSAKDNSGNDLRRRAKENFKFGIDYYGIENGYIGINGEYVGKRYDDSARKIQTGKYTLINLTANYDFTKNINAFLKIENLSDKYYQSVDGYASSERAYYGGIKMTF